MRPTAGMGGRCWSTEGLGPCAAFRRSGRGRRKQGRESGGKQVSMSISKAPRQRKYKQVSLLQQSGRSRRQPKRRTVSTGWKTD
jgi:hypothetical protein